MARFAATKLKCFKESTGLSNEEIGRRTNLGIATVARLLHAEYQPRFRTLTALARLMDVSANELIDEE